MRTVTVVMVAVLLLTTRAVGAAKAPGAAKTPRATGAEWAATAAAKACQRGDDRIEVFGSSIRHGANLHAS